LTRTICPPAWLYGVVSHTRPAPAAIARGSRPRFTRYMIAAPSPGSWSASRS